MIKNIQYLTILLLISASCIIATPENLYLFEWTGNDQTSYDVFNISSTKFISNNNIKNNYTQYLSVVSMDSNNYLTIFGRDWSGESGYSLSVITSDGKFVSQTKAISQPQFNIYYDTFSYEASLNVVVFAANTDQTEVYLVLYDFNNMVTSQVDLGVQSSSDSIPTGTYDPILLDFYTLYEIDGQLSVLKYNLNEKSASAPVALNFKGRTSECKLIYAVNTLYLVEKYSYTSGNLTLNEVDLTTGDLTPLFTVPNQSWELDNYILADDLQNLILLTSDGEKHGKGHINTITVYDLFSNSNTTRPISEDYFPDYFISYAK